MRQETDFLASLAPSTLVVLACIADRRELIARKGKPFFPRGGRRRIPACAVAALVMHGLAVVSTSETGIRRARLTPSGTAVAQAMIAAKSTRRAVA